jgi:hypothetical protein
MGYYTYVLPPWFLTRSGNDGGRMGLEAGPQLGPQEACGGGQVHLCAVLQREQHNREAQLRRPCVQRVLGDGRRRRE